MSAPVTSTNDPPLETSFPVDAVPLESILCTEELQSRTSRPPDHQKENCALVALVRALADSPSTILETLTKTIQDITQCDSAGLSLLTRDGKTTLVLHGEDDQIVPVKDSAKKSAKLIKGAKEIYYPGAPHGLTATH